MISFLGKLPPCAFRQVQAAIKKKVEKQKKQVEMGVVEAFSSNTRTKVRQKRNKPIQASNRADGGEEEDEEESADTGEAKEREELDLVPLVASVFGQVRTYNTHHASNALNLLSSTYSTYYSFYSNVHIYFNLKMFFFTMNTIVCQSYYQERSKL